MKSFNKKFNYLYYFILIIIIFSIIPLFSSYQCPYNTPFYLKELMTCVTADDCPPDYLNSGKCIISNETLEMQWLNNIISFFNYTNFTLDYVDIYTTSNGNLVLSANNNKKESRLFYVLTNEGRGYFINEETNNESPFYLFENLLYSKNHGNIFSIKLNNTIDSTEYILSISPNNTCEIYDIKSKKAYENFMSEIFSTDYSYQYVAGFIEVGNKYLLGMIGDFDNSPYFFIYILSFDSIMINEANPAIISEKFNSSKAQIVSCFKTKQNYIICFYQDYSFLYNVVVYNGNLEYITSVNLDSQQNPENYFFKCVHYYEETGAFGFFNSDGKFIFKFKYLNTDLLLENYYSKRESLNINIDNLYNDVENNDIIKLDEKRLCFISINPNVLYLVLIYDYYLGNIKNRYYKISMYDLYLYEFNNKMSISLYNGFICIASSYMQIKSLNDNGIEESSSLIILSYANSKDFDIDITNNLINKENITIELNSHCNIDNNIFGLVSKGFKIFNFSEQVELISDLSNNIINEGETIKYDENLSLSISKNITNIRAFGTIKYAMIVTEPDYDIYNKYSINTECNCDEEDIENDGYFVKRNYIGKHSYCNIIINENKITNQCQNNNCILCLYENITDCILYSIEPIDTEIQITSSIIIQDYSTITSIESEDIKDNSDKELYSYVSYSENKEDTESKSDVLDSENNEETESKSDISNTENIESTQLNSDISTSEYIEFTELKSNISEKINTIELKSDISSRENIEVSELNSDTSNIENTGTNESQSDIPDTEKIKDSESQSDISDTEKVKDSESKFDDISESDNIKDTESKSDISPNNYLNKLNCTKNEIIDGDCFYENLNLEKTEEIKKEILENKNITTIVIKGKNITIQLTNTTEQKKDFPQISNIDLGECGELLKDEYNISKNEDLVIYKVDLNTEDLSSTYVVYEVYDPTKTIKLDLEICKDVRIEINIPVQLGNNLNILYDSLAESGYNLFNENDSFYHDICSPYTTFNGTDILLSDRKKDIYSLTQNQTLCPEGCDFNSYNSTNKKAKCNCEPIKTEVNDLNIKDLFDREIITESFYNTLTNSNFQVLKCIKLLFSTNFAKNMGEIIMTLNLGIFSILGIVSLVISSNILNEFIKRILDNHSLLDNVLSSRNNIPFKTKNKKIKKLRKKKVSTKKLKNSPSIKKNRKAKADFNYQKSENLSLSKKLHFKSKTLKEKNKGKISINRKINSQKDVLIYNNKKSKKFLDKKNISNYSNIFRNNSNMKIMDVNKDILLNDYELNNLEYKQALAYDKRTYFQYYWSLIKRKQIIIFAFFSSNDYNIRTIKITLFLFSFELFFTINTFFFTDGTMHKIYKNNGKYDFFFQIPRIIYSSIISSIINVVVKLLALSEKELLSIKKKNFREAKEYSQKVKKRIYIKFIIFFLLGIVLLLFFTYFISCFCVVYINTQIILIKNTLLSFTLSMIYPFGFCLLTAIFRVLALNAENKDKFCLYNFSLLLQII